MACYNFVRKVINRNRRKEIYYEKEIFKQSNGSRFKCRIILIRILACHGSVEERRFIMRKRFLNKVMALGLSAGLFLTGSMSVMAASGGGGRNPKPRYK